MLLEDFNFKASQNNNRKFAKLMWYRKETGWWRKRVKSRKQTKRWREESAETQFSIAAKQRILQFHYPRIRGIIEETPELSERMWTAYNELAAIDDDEEVIVEDCEDEYGVEVEDSLFKVVESRADMVRHMLHNLNALFLPTHHDLVNIPAFTNTLRFVRGFEQVGVREMILPMFVLWEYRRTRFLSFIDKLNYHFDHYHRRYELVTQAPWEWSHWVRGEAFTVEGLVAHYIRKRWWLAGVFFPVVYGQGSIVGGKN